jgi:hypothetical protein
MACGATVILGGEGRSGELLKQEFPQLGFIPLPGYGITYPERGGMALHMFFSASRILQSIREEHLALDKIIEVHKIDLVISDNRYGLWSTKIPCIFMTHQVFIKASAASGLLHKLTAKYMSRFSECWIPDLEGAGNLSGTLSQKSELPEHCFFIGPQSRFNAAPKHGPSDYDVVISLSGPEPQRTAFEKEVRVQLAGLSGRILLLQGVTDKPFKQTEANLTVVSHLASEALLNAMSGAELLISRSGYSSIMDAAVLGKKCIFIPTPGQTEQEYLAAYHAEKGHCLVLRQNNFDLIDSIRKADGIKGFEKNLYSDAVLKERLSKWLGR